MCEEIPWHLYVCFRTTYGEVVCLENEGHFLVDFK